MKYSSRESKLVKSKNTLEVALGLADTKKAIELLYSQYRMPIRTCVQELVSNAFDAMTNAKSDKPIEIQLPNELNDNTFYVRDFGHSMNEDTVKNVYMKVNATTKGKNNDQIGGYGIGSKTPWAYTDTFIMTTFLDGIETQYLLVKGRSSVSIIHTGDTNEENGTKVTFQTKPSDSSDFKKAVRRISLCAKVKPVVNGQFSLDFDYSEKLNNVVTIVKDQAINNSIMFDVGGVLYPCDSDYKVVKPLKSLLKDATVVISVPVGGLIPLQTREGLFTAQKEGEHNRTMIKKLTRYTTKIVDNHIKVLLSKCDTIPNVIKLYKNGLFNIKQSFNIDGISVSSNYVTLPVDCQFTNVSRKSKTYGHSKNKNARKAHSNSIRHGALTENKFYFSEEKGTKSRLCSRLHTLAESFDCTVLESEFFENDQVFNLMVKVTGATNVMDITIPKRPKKAYSGGTVDSDAIAVYDINGSRSSYTTLYYSEDYSDKKYIPVAKGSSTFYNVHILENQGYSVICVAPSKLKKLMEKDGFYNEHEVINFKQVAKDYALWLADESSGKIQLEGKVTEYLDDNKAKLFNDVRCNFHFSRYREYKEVTVAMNLYPHLVKNTVKKVLKRKFRAKMIEDKVPLVNVISSYKLDKLGKKHLQEYVQQRIG